MDRAEWLIKIRQQIEALYDRIAPKYWVTFGYYPNETHLQFIEKLLTRVKPASTILDAACGAGRYDGLLLNAGHTVVGIDQSSRMLARARDHYPLDKFPKLSYLKIALQEMDFSVQFDGVICIDAMEHVFPEDWPVIVSGFRRALKQSGSVYATVEIADEAELSEAYKNALAQGLPVVYGEVADKIDAGFNQIAAIKGHEIPAKLAGQAAYHYYPSEEQVRGWFGQAGLTLVEEAEGNGYSHFLAIKES
jgi:2-polyprenyl-3-methyl-5-hydroxy-6-metoxy-1,4-benzoquinol methylase